MGGEQRPAAIALVQMLDRRPGDRQAVESGVRGRSRRGSPAPFAGLIENDGGFHISTMKVERPRARSSAAPTRENSRSTIPIRARFAGTKQPVCAISAISAFWRRKVDLPAMLGPVISQICPAPPYPSPLAAATGRSCWR